MVFVLIKVFHLKVYAEVETPRPREDTALPFKPCPSVEAVEQVGLLSLRKAVPPSGDAQGSPAVSW